MRADHHDLFLRTVAGAAAMPLHSKCGQSYVRTMTERTRLEAFLAVADFGGFRQAGPMLGRSATTLSKDVSLLEADLETALFTGAGKGKKLNEAGLALWHLLRANGTRDEAMERVAAMTAADIRGRICSPENAGKAGEHRSGGARPSGPLKRLRISLPEHPTLSFPVRDALLATPAVASIAEFVRAMPWVDVVPAILSGKIDAGFCWSVGSSPDGYSAIVRAERLRPDKFDHLITYFTYRASFQKHVPITKIIKMPVALPAAVGQPGFRAALEKGLKRFAVTVHPVGGEVPRDSGLLTPELAVMPTDAFILRPLQAVTVDGGLDAVFRADADPAAIEMVVETLRTRFASDAERARPKELWEIIRERNLTESKRPAPP